MEILSEFLKNCDQRNQMAVEFIHNSSKILLLLCQNANWRSKEHQKNVLISPFILFCCIYLCYFSSQNFISGASKFLKNFYRNSGFSNVAPKTWNTTTRMTFTISLLCCGASGSMSDIGGRMRRHYRGVLGRCARRLAHNVAREVSRGTVCNIWDARSSTSPAHKWTAQNWGIFLLPPASS